jgi:DNA repair photolyase
MSIAVFDHELQQSVEPGTPSAEARLATIRAATDAGFRCTVLVMPVLPYLTDSVAHLDRAFGMIAEAGAVSAVYSALHLRPGVKDWFFLWLEREYPELVGRYRELYRAGAYAPKEYRRWLSGRIRPIVRKYGLDRARLDPMTGTVRGNASLLAAELAPSAAATLQPTLF